MGKMLLILRHELVTTLVRPSFLFGALGVPLFAGLLVLGTAALGRNVPAGAAAPGGGAEVPRALAEGYVDKTGLIQAIPPDVPAGRLRPYANEAQAQRALRAGEIGAYYVIPADYVASGSLLCVNPRYNVAEGGAQSPAMRQTLLANLLGNDAERLARISQPMNLKMREMAAAQREDTGRQLTFYAAYATTLLFTLLILSSASLLLSSVSAEKDGRVLEILLSSATSQQILAGKFLALGIAGLAQMMLWLDSAFALLRLSGNALRLPPELVPSPSILAWGIVFALLGYLVYGSLMAGLGALVPSYKEASQATIVAIWPLVLSLVILMASYEAPHKPLIVALSLFPLSAPVAMMTRLVAGGVPWWQPFLAAGLMLGTGVAIIRAVAGMFHAQILLSGQPFSARRFLAALAGRS